MSGKPGSWSGNYQYGGTPTQQNKLGVNQQVPVPSKTISRGPQLYQHSNGAPHSSSVSAVSQPTYSKTSSTNNHGGATAETITRNSSSTTSTPTDTSAKRSTSSKKYRNEELQPASSKVSKGVHSFILASTSNTRQLPFHSQKRKGHRDLSFDVFSESEFFTSFETFGENISQPTCDVSVHSRITVTTTKSLLPTPNVSAETMATSSVIAEDILSNVVPFNSSGSRHVSNIPAEAVSRNIGTCQLHQNAAHSLSTQKHPPDPNVGRTRYSTEDVQSTPLLPTPKLQTTDASMQLSDQLFSLTGIYSPSITPLLPTPQQTCIQSSSSTKPDNSFWGPREKSTIVQSVKPSASHFNPNRTLINPSNSRQNTTIPQTVAIHTPTGSLHNSVDQLNHNHEPYTRVSKVTKSPTTAAITLFSSSDSRHVSNIPAAAVSQNIGTCQLRKNATRSSSTQKHPLDTNVSQACYSTEDVQTTPLLPTPKLQTTDASMQFSDQLFSLTSVYSPSITPLLPTPQQTCIQSFSSTKPINSSWEPRQQSTTVQLFQPSASHFNPNRTLINPSNSRQNTTIPQTVAIHTPTGSLHNSVDQPNHNPESRVQVSKVTKSPNTTAITLLPKKDHTGINNCHGIFPKPPSILLSTSVPTLQNIPTQYALLPTPELALPFTISGLTTSNLALNKFNNFSPTCHSPASDRLFDDTTHTSNRQSSGNSIVNQPLLPTPHTTSCVQPSSSNIADTQQSTALCNDATISSAVVVSSSQSEATVFGTNKSIARFGSRKNDKAAILVPTPISSTGKVNGNLGHAKSNTHVTQTLLPTPTDKTDNLQKPLNQIRAIQHTANAKPTQGDNAPLMGKHVGNMKEWHSNRRSSVEEEKMSNLSCFPGTTASLTDEISHSVTPSSIVTTGRFSYGLSLQSAKVVVNSKTATTGTSSEKSSGRPCLLPSPATNSAHSNTTELLVTANPIRKNNYVANERSGNVLVSESLLPTPFHKTEVKNSCTGAIPVSSKSSRSVFPLENGKRVVEVRSPSDSASTLSTHSGKKMITREGIDESTTAQCEDIQLNKTIPTNGKERPLHYDLVAVSTSTLPDTPSKSLIQAFSANSCGSVSAASHIEHMVNNPLAYPAPSLNHTCSRRTQNELKRKIEQSSSVSSEDGLFNQSQTSDMSPNHEVGLEVSNEIFSLNIERTEPSAIESLTDGLLDIPRNSKMSVEQGKTSKRTLDMLQKVDHTLTSSTKKNCSRFSLPLASCKQSATQLTEIPISTSHWESASTAKSEVGLFSFIQQLKYVPNNSFVDSPDSSDEDVAELVKTDISLGTTDMLKESENVVDVDNMVNCADHKQNKPPGAVHNSSHFCPTAKSAALAHPIIGNQLLDSCVNDIILNCTPRDNSVYDHPNWLQIALDRDSTTTGSNFSPESPVNHTQSYGDEASVAITSDRSAMSNNRQLSFGDNRTRPAVSSGYQQLSDDGGPVNEFTDIEEIPVQSSHFDDVFEESHQPATDSQSPDASKPAKEKRKILPSSLNNSMAILAELRKLRHHYANLKSDTGPSEPPPAGIPGLSLVNKNEPIWQPAKKSTSNLTDANSGMLPPPKRAKVSSTDESQVKPNEPGLPLPKSSSATSADNIGPVTTLPPSRHISNQPAAYYTTSAAEKSSGVEGRKLSTPLTGASTLHAAQPSDESLLKLPISPREIAYAELVKESSRLASLPERRSLLLPERRGLPPPERRGLPLPERRGLPPPERRSLPLPERRGLPPPEIDGGLPPPKRAAHAPPERRNLPPPEVGEFPLPPRRGMRPPGWRPPSSERRGPQGTRPLPLLEMEVYPPPLHKPRRYEKDDYLPDDVGYYDEGDYPLERSYHRHPPYRGGSKPPPGRPIPRGGRGYPLQPGAGTPDSRPESRQAPHAPPEVAEKKKTWPKPESEKAPITEDLLPYVGMESCDICNVEYTHPIHAKSHLVGKNHHKKLKLLGLPIPDYCIDKSKPKTNPPPKPGTGTAESTEASEEVEWPEWLLAKFHDDFCGVCNVPLSSGVTANAHYVGKKHIKKCKAYLNISKKEGTVTQLTSQFFCEICNIHCSAQEVLDQHLAGQKHKQAARWHRAVNDRPNVSEIRETEVDVDLLSKEDLDTHLEKEKTEADAEDFFSQAAKMNGL